MGSIYKVLYRFLIPGVLLASVPVAGIFKPLCGLPFQPTGLSEHRYPGFEDLHLFPSYYSSLLLAPVPDGSSLMVSGPGSWQYCFESQICPDVACLILVHLSAGLTSTCHFV